MKSGFIGTDTEYLPLYEDEVWNYALDYLSGNIIGSWQIGAHDMEKISTIFFPISTVDVLKPKEWMRDQITQFIGLVDDAIQLSEDEYIFITIRPLTNSDAERIIKTAALLKSQE